MTGCIYISSIVYLIRIRYVDVVTGVQHNVNKSNKHSNCNKNYNVPLVGPIDTNCVFVSPMHPSNLHLKAKDEQLGFCFVRNGNKMFLDVKDHSVWLCNLLITTSIQESKKVFFLQRKIKYQDTFQLEEDKNKQKAKAASSTTCTSFNFL